MKQIGVGQVLRINNNYGIIRTKSLNREGDIEEFPFEVSTDMIKEINGESFVKYSDEVEFEKDNLDGVRREGRVIQLGNLSFIGEEKLHKRNYLEETYIDKIMRKLKEFNFDISDLEKLNNVKKMKHLNNIGFKPRMLDYLINGVFYNAELKKQFLEGNNFQGISPEDLILDIESIVLLDKIDLKFRLYLIEWILQIEDIIKSYLSELAKDKKYDEILNESLAVWVGRKGFKHIQRARTEKIFRSGSDEYDYVTKSFCPFEDFLSQLDLAELREFFGIWYEKSPRIRRTGKIGQIYKSIKYFGELSILRNAAAHGRPIIPGFMDPDYNANWDLEFDFTEKRTKLTDWELYPIFNEFWIKTGCNQDHISKKIQTVFGNKFRRSWVILNYLYFTLVQKIDLKAFEYFKFQANHFLQKNTTSFSDLYDLKLADMGSITFEEFTSAIPPYEEIRMETNIIWNYYNLWID